MPGCRPLDDPRQAPSTAAALPRRRRSGDRSAARLEVTLVDHLWRAFYAAPGRAVLRFTRIDFRLAWFRHMFPAVHFVHLYRHPLDQ